MASSTPSKMEKKVAPSSVVFDPLSGGGGGDDPLGASSAMDPLSMAVAAVSPTSSASSVRIYPLSLYVSVSVCLSVCLVCHYCTYHELLRHPCKHVVTETPRFTNNPHCHSATQLYYWLIISKKKYRTNNEEQYKFHSNYSTTGSKTLPRKQRTTIRQSTD